MKTDWLSNLVVDTKLIENSSLSEKERHALLAYLKEQKTYKDIGNEIELTDERVRQLIENGIGKIFFAIKDLLAKAQWLQKTLAEKEALDQELKNLRIKFKKQLAAEQQLKMNFDQVNVSTDQVKFSMRAKKILDELDVKSIKELSNLTKQSLYSKDGVGTKTVEEIIRKAEEYGIKIK